MAPRRLRAHSPSFADDQTRTDAHRVIERARGAKPAVFTALAAMLFAALVAPREASAQARDGQARGMVRQALEDYQNLDVDGAMNRLRLAVNLCGTRNCSSQVLARVHMAMGVVAVGGQNDSTAGIEQFVTALRADNTAEPDAMLVTPEITAALAQARQRVRGGGGGTPVSNPPTGGNTGGGNSGGGNSGGGTPGMLLHTAPTEQVENTPLPVYVEPGSVRATRYVVRYRGLGMSNFAELDLTSIGSNGFGGEIPCGQVIQPSIEYYVAALDASGSVVGTAGASSTPNRVSIVRTRTRPAPALPGRMPPEQCREDCPPGMTGPQCHNRGGGGGGTRQMGDPCERNDQCSEGLHCDAGSCAAGEPSGGTPAPRSNHYIFGIDVGAGVGLGLLSGNTNTNPVTWQGVPGPPLFVRDAEGNVLLTNGRPMNSPINSDLSYAEFDRNTGMCAPPPNAPAGATAPSCPGSVSTGFAPAGFVYFALRLSPFRQAVVERLAFAVNGRFQWDNSGTGTLPMLFIGGRLSFALTSGGWQRNGPIVAVFAGSGVGQMQVRPLAPAGSPMGTQTGHFINGLNNAHVGVRFEYGFGNIGHIGIEGTANLQIPNFMFVADLQGTVGVHF